LPCEEWRLHIEVRPAEERMSGWWTWEWEIISCVKGQPWSENDLNLNLSIQ
jgi:hypothetical protein